MTSFVHLAHEFGHLALSIKMAVKAYFDDHSCTKQLVWYKVDHFKGFDSLIFLSNCFSRNVCVGYMNLDCYAFAF